MVLRIFINFIRVILLKIRYIGRGKINPIQLWSMSTLITIGSKATAVLEKGIKTRRGCTLSSVSGELVIHEGCFFNTNCSITCLQKITIGNNISFCPNVVIFDHDHNYKAADQGYVCSEVRIRNNVWIGANSVILRGSVIGDNCVVAAGSVIRGQYGDNLMIYNIRSTNTKTISK